MKAFGDRGAAQLLSDAQAPAPQTTPSLRWGCLAQGWAGGDGVRTAGWHLVATAGLGLAWGRAPPGAVQKAGAFVQGPSLSRGPKAAHCPQVAEDHPPPSRRCPKLWARHRPCLPGLLCGAGRAVLPQPPGAFPQRRAAGGFGWQFMAHAPEAWGSSAEGSRALPPGWGAGLWARWSWAPQPLRAHEDAPRQCRFSSWKVGASDSG